MTGVTLEAYERSANGCLMQDLAAVQRSWGGTRIATHALGNLFLGIALGLAAYYGLTDVLARSAQSGLETELAELGPVSLPEPPVEEGPNWFESWEEEDLAYWRALPLGGVFGRLVVPELGIDEVVVKGTERRHLQAGPGWIIQTDFPGPTGNVGISGHRTTWGAPFRRIEEFEVGQRFEFYSPYRRYTYEVVEELVVTPDQVEVVASTEEPMMTLTACHPVYSARFRWIVRSILVDVARLADTES